MIFNPFKQHLVRFSNGKYGVRKWLFIWWYKDLKLKGLWWSKGSDYFSDCMSIEKPTVNNDIKEKAIK